MKTKITINLRPAYVPFDTVEALYEFETQIEFVMLWKHYVAIDDELAVASDDYVRLSFASTDDKDDEDETAEVYGVSIVAHYANIAQIFSAVEVIEQYGYDVFIDENSIIEEPDSDLIPCYWEE